MIKLQIENDKEIDLLPEQFSNILEQKQHFEYPQLQIHEEKQEHTLICSLKILIKQNNQIDSQFSQNLANLLILNKNLTNFQLIIEGSNKLDEECSFYLGEAIKECQNIEHLTFKIEDQNNMTQILAYILQGISFCKKIKEFRFHVGEQQIGEEFGMDGSRMLGFVLNEFKHLEKLQITLGNNNLIDAESFELICEGIKDQTFLQEFSLNIGDFNGLGVQGLSQISQLVASNQGLKFLCLKFGKHNQVNDQGLRLLESGFQNCHSLEQFILEIKQDNQIGESGLKSIGGLMHNLSKLIQLGINLGKQCCPSSNGFQYLLSEIKSCENLKNLKILIGDGNHFGEIGSIGFEQGLQYLQYLEELNIHVGDDNNLKSTGTKNLASSIRKYQNLKILKMSILYNEIGKIGAQELALSLQNFSSLIQFNLHLGNCNFIESEGIESLSQAFQKLKNLRFLDIHMGNGNKIGNQGIIEISKSLSSLKQLVYLGFSFGANKLNRDALKCLQKVILTLQNLNVFRFNIYKNEKIKSQEISQFLKSFMKLKKLVNILPY
ncbi:hypothetical protein ABPG72_021377 [Tetrahymena utriculariae]